MPAVTALVAVDVDVDVAAAVLLLFFFIYCQAEGLLTYVIHPPQNRAESYDENGVGETVFALDEKAFLDVRKKHRNRQEILGRRCVRISHRRVCAGKIACDCDVGSTEGAWTQRKCEG